MRRRVVALLLFAVSFGVYVGNGETIASGDTVPATLAGYMLIAHGTLSDDAVRGSYLDGPDSRYAFTESATGHLVSLFPIGTPLLTLPLLLALGEARVAMAPEHRLPALEPPFDDARRFDEKLVAAGVAALAVALCYLTLRLYATPFQAGLGTFVFGFAGELWTIGSQGLWQHGPLNLVLLAAVYCSLRATAAPSRLLWFAAGLCAGYLVTIRPTALLFTLALVAFVALERERRAGWRAYLPGLALGLAPGVLWNALVFHSLVGGYAADAMLYRGGKEAAIGLAGLLVSPNRGWLVFSPVVLFSAAGLVRAARERTPAARMALLLGIAALAVLGNYASYDGWVGGHCYGPRFLTDLSAAAASTLPFILPPSLRSWRAQRRGALRNATALGFAALLSASTFVQIVGAYSGAAGPIWNAIPIDIGIEPGRIWSWHDTQIARNARAMFYRYAPPPTLGVAYATGFAGSVDDLEPRRWAAGAGTVVSARVHNAGTVPWYGYDTAVYNGEARVTARVIDTRGTLVSHARLFIAGVVPPGAYATARGVVMKPPAPGRYRIELRLEAFARKDVLSRNLPARAVSVEVR